MFYVQFHSRCSRLQTLLDRDIVLTAVDLSTTDNASLAGRSSSCCIKSSYSTSSHTYIIIILTLGTYNPEGSKCKIGYDHQSVQFVAGKLSCRRTALKNWIKIEILWYRKLVSQASPEFSEILLPRSSRRWRADALKLPRSYRNWLKGVTSTEVDVFLLFAGGCHLCCCTFLKSGSVNVWLSQWARDKSRSSITTCRSAKEQAWRRLVFSHQYGIAHLLFSDGNSCWGETASNQVVKSVMPSWPARSSSVDKTMKPTSVNCGATVAVVWNAKDPTLTANQLRLSPLRHLTWAHMRQSAVQRASRHCAVKRLRETMPGDVQSWGWLPLWPYHPARQSGPKMVVWWVGRTSGTSPNFIDQSDK